MLNQEEYIERLNDLKKGPWTENSKKAKTYLAPINNVEELTDNRQLIVLPEMSARDKELKRVLRWHIYEEIISAKELDIRISLDYALEYLQLIELSIETGYIDLETVRDEVRKEFASLLWSKPSRDYVLNYDLIAIEYLAKRVNVSGFRDHIKPPTIDRKAYFRFASFLSNHLIWHQDHYIDMWISFLDDYVDNHSEKIDFYLFVHGDEAKRSIKFANLLVGIERFVDCLFDTFDNLKLREYGRFGLFYSYWLAKFFGHNINEKRFINNKVIKEVPDGWAYIFVDSQSIFFSNNNYSEEQVIYYKKIFTKKIKTLQKVWERTRKLIDDSDLSYDLVNVI